MPLTLKISWVFALQKFNQAIQTLDYANYKPNFLRRTGDARMRIPHGKQYFSIQNQVPAIIDLLWNARRFPLELMMQEANLRWKRSMFLSEPGMQGWKSPWTSWLFFSEPGMQEWKSSVEGKNLLKRTGDARWQISLARRIFGKIRNVVNIYQSWE